MPNVDDRLNLAEPEPIEFFGDRPSWVLVVILGMLATYGLLHQRTVYVDKPVEKIVEVQKIVEKPVYRTVYVNDNEWRTRYEQSRQQYDRLLVDFRRAVELAESFSKGR